VSNGYQSFLCHKIYLHTTTDNGCTVHTDKGGGREGWGFGGLVKLGSQAP